MSTPQPQQDSELFLDADARMSDVDIAPNRARFAVSDQQRVVEQFLTQQILAQGTTNKWSGQGKGSAQANAADMAKIMANSGITDINQFGKVALYEPVHEISKTFNGQNVSLGYDAKTGTQTYGTYTGAVQTDGEGNEYNSFVPIPQNAKLQTVYGLVRDGGESGGYLEPVDASKIKTVDGKLVGDTGQTTFGNKLTGQAIANNYETGSNAFAGTYDGKGNTGYRVEFDAQGNPLFYTTGASSSDVPKWVKPALILGAAYFGLDAAGLLGGGLGATEAAALTAGDLAIGGGALAGTPFTAAQLAGFTAGAGGAVSNTGLLSGASGAALTPAEISALTAQDLAIGGGGLAGYAPLTAAEIAGLTATDLAIGGTAGGAGLLPGLTAAQLAALSSGGLLSSGSLTAGLTPAQIAAGETVLTTTAGTTAGSKVLTDALTRAGVTAAVNNILGGGGTTGTNLSNLFSGGLGTAGNLLQMQQSREAAQQAQARIDAETAAAKAAAQFRPIGMTTRFGTSQFQTDPVTGQLTSAGYTLSPEAKAQQDRFVALSNQGLTQAEGAQAQFAPLQTGAQSLFNLGNKYISQSPQDVAQNYLNQQMALLQPGRETELANLQTKLRNQGRMGLSVSQGGNLGATTPELQALYNARAQQEAVLAANAQQAGQQQVLYGAGLLGQGSQAMGQYYGGQQAAYAPYATAQGQVQALETLGQQPFNMSSALAQQSAAAGSRAGQLGLEGARLSAGLATSADATRNLGAQSLMAAGNSNGMFGQSLNNVFSGLFGNTPQGSLTTGFTPNSIQAGEFGYPIDPNFSGPLYY